MRRLGKQLLVLLGLVYSLTAALFAQESILENNRSFIFDTSSMLFIEVDRHELRVEIMVKGAPLIKLLNFEVEGERIVVEQQARLKKQAVDYFSDRFVLALDGLPATPGTASASFLNIGDVDSVIKETVSDEPLADAVLGMTYIFPVDRVPDYFQFTWNQFLKELGRIPAQIRMLDQVQPFELNEYMPTMDWNRGTLDFTLPEILPIAVEETDWLGRPKLPDQAAVKVMGQLLKNIYGAFEYPEESAIYDQLAVSVNGKQIETLYLEQRERMEALRRGGPRVKIHAVSMNHVEDVVRSGPTFEVTGQWDVSGTVSHFGHTHERTNRYGAMLTLLPINQQWKISEIEVLNEKRVE